MGAFRTRDPVAYVIMFEKDDGERRYHGSELLDGQVALRCYPSPFDALLDISRNPAGVVGREQSIVIHPVDALRPEAGETPGYRPVIACVHVAWRACSGKLLIRPDGMPDAVLSTSSELESGDTVRELPGRLLRLVDEIHEQAGLFAWKETVNTFSDWSERDLRALAHQAWRDAPTMEADDAKPGFDQFALFAPEFRQWHFVPAIEIMARCAAASARH
ncbi:hypothetical protein P0D88_41355 [Paraburkholderia sp. RL18-103-BIB-C]|jgi:hypothetical protein|uniref:hypothetical protein n=2 Tax=unclassified Paraburkholderia TaxID=2615204 RepID=UPI0038BD43CA